MRKQTNQRTSHAGKTKINNIGHEETNKQTNQRTSHAGKTKMKYISARKADNKAMNNVSQEARWSGERTRR